MERDFKTLESKCLPGFFFFLRFFFFWCGPFLKVFIEFVTDKNEIYKESYLINEKKKEQNYNKSEEKKEIEEKVEEKKDDKNNNEEYLSIDFLNKIKSSIPHILLINLESNHLKKDKLEELMKNIYEEFEKKGEDISKNDFI